MVLILLTHFTQLSVPPFLPFHHFRRIWLKAVLKTTIKVTTCSTHSPAKQGGQMKPKHSLCLILKPPSPRFFLQNTCTWALSILWFYFMDSKYQPHLGHHFCQSSFTSKSLKTMISFCCWVKMKAFYRCSQHPKLLNSELMKRKNILSGADPDSLISSPKRNQVFSKTRDTLAGSCGTVGAMRALRLASDPQPVRSQGPQYVTAYWNESCQAWTWKQSFWMKLHMNGLLISALGVSELSHAQLRSVQTSNPRKQQ